MGKKKEAVAQTAAAKGGGQFVDVEFHDDGGCLLVLAMPCCCPCEADVHRNNKMNSQTHRKRKLEATKPNLKPRLPAAMESRHMPSKAETKLAPTLEPLPAKPDGAVKVHLGKIMDGFEYRGSRQRRHFQHFIAGWCCPKQT